MWGDDDDENGQYASTYPRGYTYRVEYQGPRGFEHLQSPGYRMPRTSRQEMMDLAIAVTVLTIIFGMPGGILYTMAFPPLYLAIMFGIAFVAVMLSIFPHELAHKFVAQRYGYWAEFRRYDMGLILGLVLSLSGFPVIAAPGAVMIAGPVTTETNGKISAVGPGTNALMGALLFPVAFLAPPSSLVGYLAAMIVWVNVLLGAFNMIPFGIFDGAKIWRWNAGAYLGLLAVLLSMGAAVFLSGILY